MLEAERVKSDVRRQAGKVEAVRRRLREVEDRVRAWKEGEATRERARALEEEGREVRRALAAARWREAVERLAREESELEGERERKREVQCEMVRLLGLRQELEGQREDR